jgi:hypothetical protein
MDASLIGKKVKITMKRTGTPFPGMDIRPYSFNATLEHMEGNTIKIKKETGMTFQLNLKDQYMTVLDIKPAQ